MATGEPSRLTARPDAAGPSAPPLAAGTQALGLAPGRDAWIVVPHEQATPVPLLVLLHGAGSSGRAMLRLLAASAEGAGILVLAPDARASTWDVLRGGYGPDVAFIDAGLAAVHERWSVDPSRVVLAGFSDGASYALSLGISNGDRFSHIVAFSPGFMAPAAAHGRPPVFVSHGRGDQVLPIDRCSRRVVPALRRVGHEVRYVEFDGGHGVPGDVARDALAWVSRTPSSAPALTS